MLIFRIPKSKYLVPYVAVYPQQRMALNVNIITGVPMKSRHIWSGITMNIEFSFMPFHFCNVPNGLTQRYMIFVFVPQVKVY